MTFSCIKFKKKFKMKFSLANGSNDGNEVDEDDECHHEEKCGIERRSTNSDLGVKEPPQSGSSSASSGSGSGSGSRSSSVASGGVAKTTSNLGAGVGVGGAVACASSKSYSGLSRDIDLNTSTTGLCRTSSSHNETVTQSYDVSARTGALAANTAINDKSGKTKKGNNKKFKLRRKPKKG